LGPLLGEGITELLAEGWRSMRLEVDFCFVHVARAAAAT
jgi:hypothetical protein